MSGADPDAALPPMARRFRGFLPVVVDLETGGFNSATDAVLEVAAFTLAMDPDGELAIDRSYSSHVEPFEGANIEAASLEFTGIDPFNPLRGALPEREAFRDMFKMIRESVKANGCNRAILVGHNAHFDHAFVRAASERGKLKRNPFHPFSSLDTTSLGGLAFGQTVLARACRAAGIEFENDEAHSARYDARKTAELFCAVVNRWKALGGWPPPGGPSVPG